MYSVSQNNKYGDGCKSYFKSHLKQKLWVKKIFITIELNKFNTDQDYKLKMVVNSNYKFTLQLYFKQEKRQFADSIPAYSNGHSMDPLLILSMTSWGCMPSTVQLPDWAVPRISFVVSENF